ncbi:hypothetical protein SALWKB12_1318 [Snodgrassella communis]|uniref:Uncharacterized protein n=1 Tax=Snodgrassella communis TaxID=2946699 RepID=A0A836MRT2_9NEIS|nr:hypothetical protein SALWKB12_1318 [Snodgrassella communis]KDN15028.1 hypothetical protein SALWKB29_1100 [Snodgrassella communis]
MVKVTGNTISFAMTILVAMQIKIKNRLDKRMDFILFYNIQ